MAEHELNKIVDDDGEVFNLRDSTKQPVADRVTAWGSTPSDTKYPSEKLVKDSLDGKIPFDYSLLDTNPFGGKHLYLNYICNAMYSMDYRYFVTVTRHKKVVDGVEYPRIKPGASVTDDVYYEDSPIVATVTSIRTLFNGDYEGYVNIPAGEYLKVHIQFSNEENWTPATGRVSDYSYNYGTYYLSFYHANIPDSAQWRCYNTYAQHTVGWKQGTFGYFAGDASSANSVILSATDNGNHKRTCIEFIVFAKESTATGLSQIDWKLQRPTLSRTFPFFTNFADQNSYVNWYFKEKVNSDPKITLSVADGNVKATTFEGKFKNPRKLAVSLSNTSTDTSFDGSADVTNIKTTGTLPVANGGTGNSSVDTTPTASSTKMVTSGGIYNALADKVQKIEFSQPAEYKSFVVIEDITQWYDPAGTASLSKHYQMIGQLAYWRTGAGYENMEVAFIKFHLNYRWKLNNSECCEICSTIPAGAFRPMIVRDARDANNVKYYFGLRVTIAWQSTVQFIGRTKDLSFSSLTWLPGENSTHTGNGTEFPEGITIEKDCNTLKWDIDGNAKTATTATNVSNNGAGTADAARHIWFSDSGTETKRVYDNNFTYNPATNLVTANISGNAATADTLGVTLLDSSNDLNDYKGDGAGEVTIYRWISSSVPAHASTAGASAVMHVVNCYASGSTKYTKQIVFLAGANKVYERAYLGDTTGWTAWQTVVFSGDVVSTYSSSGTVPVNGKSIAAALGTLDVSSVGGAGKYISAISETDGKISATATTMDTTPTASSTNAVTSGGIKTALDGKSNTGHTHSNIVTEGDNRNVATVPDDYSNKLVFKGLKAKAAIDNPSSDTYSYLVGLRGWNNSSGGKSHELAFNNSGIFSRMGSTTSWEGWQKILTSDDLTAQARTIPQDISKGANLVVNGCGTMMSNYNFSTCEYLANTDLPTGVAGCFHKAGLTFFNNEKIAVNTSKAYYLESWYRVKTASTSTVRLSIACFDIDGKEIQANNICYGVGTLTKLTQDLNDGDTVVHLEDLSGAGWVNTTEAWQRGFIFWNYKNSLGYQYPPETYSKNVHATKYETANVNVSAGTITLNSAWSGGTIPAGTYVSRYSSGSTYYYVKTSAASGALTTWTKLEGVAKGFNTPGSADGGPFRPGTAFIKVGWVNANTSGNEWIEFAGIELREIPEQAYRLTTARKLAVSLSNTSTDTSFDGSANVTNIKTTGTLAIANGGTGATTKKAAEYAINGGMSEATATMADNFQIVFSRVGSDQSATNGVFIYRQASTVWNYIKGKMTSVSGVNISGNAATATDLAANSVLSVSKGGTGKSSVTSNSFLVGNGTSAFVEKTPSEVLSLIGGQAALTEMTTTEVTEFVAALGEL